ncbi:unnamed protein product [Darwinula stevensoni]|uniref:Uncharacterized protein n=1 Tax=Darwinula stevensoni TaxID=69355 RepID=A0A7R9A3B4_9CRUS|nr:unnamed protein product [Darwinula stevensoni]CAG0891336.1 unnamed protein product [Darwinula stevensoni]
MPGWLTPKDVPLLAKHVYRSTSSGIVSEWNHAKPFSQVPGPGLLPLFGNLLQYKSGEFKVKQYHKVLKKLHLKYGPIARQQIGPRLLVHLFDPEDVKTVYQHEGKMPVVPPLQETTQLYRKQKELSLGLGNTNHEEWYRLRSAVQQMMLRPKEVRHFLPLVNQVAKDFVDHICKVRRGDGTVHDLRTSGMICYETRLGCMDGTARQQEWGQQMVEANKTIFQLSGDLKFSLPFYAFLPTPRWNQLVRAEDFFYREAKLLVEQTIGKIHNMLKESGTLPEDRYSFLSYLLGREELSQKDVFIITLSLFADGLSTTSPALLFNLYCLATHPEAQETLRREVHENFPSSDVPITAEIINRMTYLKACVKETFRLFPIGTEVSRITQKDLVLAGYQIPANTHVDFNQFVHFRSSSTFKHPEEFRPQRWIRGHPEEETVHPYLLTPFGIGTRMCAGRRFAEQDLYLVLMHTMKTFQLSYPLEEPSLGQIYETLLFPDQPLHIARGPRREGRAGGGVDQAPRRAQGTSRPSPARASEKTKNASLATSKPVKVAKPAKNVKATTKGRDVPKPDPRTLRKPAEINPAKSLTSNTSESKRKARTDNTTLKQAPSIPKVSPAPSSVIKESPRSPRQVEPVVSAVEEVKEEEKKAESDNPATGEEVGDYDYEDDFEDYESDFESYDSEEDSEDDDEEDEGDDSEGDGEGVEKPVDSGHSSGHFSAGEEDFNERESVLKIQSRMVAPMNERYRKREEEEESRIGTAASASTQTGEDHETQEINTEQIQMESKWTQFPVSFQIPKESENGISKEEYLGVGQGSDDHLHSSHKLPLVHLFGEQDTFHGDTDDSAINGSRLAQFILSAGQVMLSLLEERTQSQMMDDNQANKEDYLDFPFTDGVIPFGKVPIPNDRAQKLSVQAMAFSPLQPNLLLTSHNMEGEELAKNSMLCLWNLREPSQPQKVFLSPGLVHCLCFGPRGTNVIMAGLQQGVISLWDVEEPSSTHQQLGVSWGYELLHPALFPRTPTYCTVATGEEETDDAVVDLKIVTDSSSETSSSDQVRSLVRARLRSFRVHLTIARVVLQVVSLTEGGMMKFWVLVKQDVDPVDLETETDVGLAHWAHWKLSPTSFSVRVGDLLLREGGETNGTLRTDSLVLNATDSNHLYVCSDSHGVVHCTRHGDTPVPRFFNPQPETVYKATSVDFAQHRRPFLLIGGADGSISLFAADSSNERPLTAWNGNKSEVPIPIKQLIWSPCRPCVFFSLDALGMLSVWDLTKGDLEPRYTVQLKSDVISHVALGSLPYLDASQQIPMAVGMSDGRIVGYRLAKDLSCRSDEDRKVEVDKFLRYVSIL